MRGAGEIGINSLDCLNCSHMWWKRQPNVIWSCGWRSGYFIFYPPHLSFTYFLCKYGQDMAGETVNYRHTNKCGIDCLRFMSDNYNREGTYSLSHSSDKLIGLNIKPGTLITIYRVWEQTTVRVLEGKGLERMEVVWFINRWGEAGYGFWE